MRISKPPQERRAELLAAARALFDEQGVDKTRVSDIVRRVGVAQGVFYYYFSSKEELVAEVVQQVAAETGGKAEAILSDEAMPFCEKLARFIEMLLDVVDTFLGDDETRLPPRAEEAMRGSLGGVMAQSLTQSMRVLIEQGAQSGQVKAQYPWQTTQVLMGGFRVYGEQQLPDKPLIYSVTEQALGLPKGALVRYADKDFLENE